MTERLTREQYAKWVQERSPSLTDALVQLVVSASWPILAASYAREDELVALVDGLRGCVEVGQRVERGLLDRVEVTESQVAELRAALVCDICAGSDSPIPENCACKGTKRRDVAFQHLRDVYFTQCQQVADLRAALASAQSLLMSDGYPHKAGWIAELDRQIAEKRKDDAFMRRLRERIELDRDLLAKLEAAGRVASPPTQEKPPTCECFDLSDNIVGPCRFCREQAASPQTGAERYLRDKLADPDYAAAYEATDPQDPT